MLSLLSLHPKDAPALRDVGHLPDLNEQAAVSGQRAARDAFLWTWKWRALMLLTHLAVTLARHRIHTMHHRPI